MSHSAARSSVVLIVTMVCSIWLFLCPPRFPFLLSLSVCSRLLSSLICKTSCFRYENYTHYSVVFQMFQKSVLYLHMHNGKKKRKRKSSDLILIFLMLYTYSYKNCHVMYHVAFEPLSPSHPPPSETTQNATFQLNSTHPNSFPPSQKFPYIPISNY